MRYTYVERPGAEAKVKSGIALARLVLSGRNELLEAHVSEVLRIAICKVTEANCRKHETRFCSLEAYSNPDRPVEHEHVDTILSLRQKLLSACPEQVESILRNAQACVVTLPEHQDLSMIPDSVCGWDRYKAAGIKVVDVKETQATGELKLLFG
ncbi:MAG: hypothetical protein ABR910_17980 [Acidobacteriaceae bacterium]|jgi:hypothetical protein